MKKIYSKPCIAVESFQLDAAIAASCSKEEKVPLNYNLFTCTPFEEEPGLFYFGPACANGGYDVISGPSDDNNGSFCYHGPMFNDMFMNS